MPHAGLGLGWLTRVNLVAFAVAALAALPATVSATATGLSASPTGSELAAPLIDPSRATLDARGTTTHPGLVGLLLADRALAALDRLARRDHFIGPDELVFVNAVGDRLDRSAPRRRYVAA